MKVKEDFNLPFGEAVKYWKQRGIVLNPGHWSNVWMQSNSRAFTVANVTEMEVLRDIKKELDKAMKEGIGFDEFKKNLKTKLTEKGWYAPKGEKAKIQMPDGSIRKRLTSWRLETIFRTNLQTAYAVGRHEQLMETVQLRPYWKYKAVMDAATRPSHAAMNGKIYLATNPVWNVWFPPNGFNCRCYVISLSVTDLEDLMDVESKFPEELPDEGWRYNPAQRFNFFSGEPELYKDLSELKNKNVLHELQIDKGLIGIDNQMQQFLAELKTIETQRKVGQPFDASKEHQLLEKVIELDKKARKKINDFISEKMMEESGSKTHKLKYILKIEGDKKEVERVLSSIEEGIEYVRTIVHPELLRKTEKGEVIGKPLRFVVKNKEGRAYYRKHENTVYLYKQSRKRTVVHELGHAIEENNPDLTFAIREFYKYRAKNFKLRVIQKDRETGEEEYGFVARFPDKYMGRLYGDVNKNGEPINLYATEILSMGLQYFLKDPLTLYKCDPESFSLITELITRRIDAEWLKYLLPLARQGKL